MNSRVGVKLLIAALCVHAAICFTVHPRPHDLREALRILERERRRLSFRSPAGGDEFDGQPFAENQNRGPGYFLSGYGYEDDPAAARDGGGVENLLGGFDLELPRDAPPAGSKPEDPLGGLREGDAAESSRKRLCGTGEDSRCASEKSNGGGGGGGVSQSKFNNLSAGDIHELLSSADKLEGSLVVGEPRDITTEPVSKKELKSLFGDQLERGGADGVDLFKPPAMDIGPEASENRPGEGSDSWDYASYFGYPFVRDEGMRRLVKRTGAGKVPERTALPQDVRRLQEVIAKLWLKNKLENMEIDYLADALNMATLSQVQDEGKYVPKEVSALEKAIRIEELLQEIAPLDKKTRSVFEEIALDYLLRDKGSAEKSKRGKRNMFPSDVNLNAPPNVRRLQEADRRRTVDEAGMWPRQLEQGADEVNPVEITDQELPSRDTVLDYQDVDAKPDISPIVEVKDVEDDINTDQEGAEQLLNAESRLQAEAALQQMLGQLHSTQRQQEDLSNSYKEDIGKCPAVAFGTNCLFADVIDVSMTDKTRSLCNRHEICYSCGVSIGISPTNCDRGFIADAINVCEEDLKCIRQADVFLRLMQVAHKREDRKKFSCQNPCVKDYVIGL